MCLGNLVYLVIILQIHETVEGTFTVGVFCVSLFFSILHPSVGHPLLQV